MKHEHSEHNLLQRHSLPLSHTTTSCSLVGVGWPQSSRSSSSLYTLIQTFSLQWKPVNDHLHHWWGVRGVPSSVDVHCRWEICLMSSLPLRTGFGSQNMRFYHEYILLLFLYFCYMKMVSNSSINITTRFLWFTRFQRQYIRPDPCTVGGDTGIWNLLAFCLPILVPHPNTAILRHFSELRDVPHIDG